MTVVLLFVIRISTVSSVPVHAAMNDLPCLGRRDGETDLPPLVGAQGGLFLGSGHNAQRRLAGNCDRCLGGGLPFRLCCGAPRIPHVSPMTAKIGIVCRQVAAAPSIALGAGEQCPVCATRCPWAFGARVSTVGLGVHFLAYA